MYIWMDLPGPSRRRCRHPPISEVRRVRPRHSTAGLVESRQRRRELAAAATVSTRVDTGQEQNVRPRMAVCHSPFPLVVPAIADPTTNLPVTSIPFSNRWYNVVRKCLSLSVPVQSYLCPSYSLCASFPIVSNSLGDHWCPIVLAVLATANRQRRMKRNKDRALMTKGGASFLPIPFDSLLIAMLIVCMGRIDSF